MTRPAGAARHHVYLASNHWDGLWIIQQPIAREIGRDESVLYVERFVSIFTLLRWPRLWRKVLGFLRGARREADQVWTLAPLPLFHLGHRFPRLFALEFALQRRWIAWWARRLGAGQRVLWMDNPLYQVAVGRMGESLAVYHVADEVSAFDTSHEATMRALEARMLEKADVVFAAAGSLAEDKRRINPDTHTVWNAIDVSLYAGEPGPTPDDVAAIPEPRVAFVGVLDRWVDVALLADTARLLPEVHFAIVGPSEIGRGELEGLANVHWLGRRPRAEVAAILRACSASLIPFKRIALTERIVPLKVFEALAAGILPVATSFSPDLPRLEADGLIALADGAAPFAAAVTRAVREDSPDQRARLARYGLEQHWGARWRQMRGVIEDRLSDRVTSGGANRLQMRRSPVSRATTKTGAR